jgi:transcriptional regulator with XRE-family HTH domain
VNSAGLAELIRERLKVEELSVRQAADRSHGLISPATLNNYSRGLQQREPSPRVLQGLALATGVSVGKLAEVGALPTVPTPFELPERAQMLTQRERKAVLAVIDAFLGSHDVD